MASTQQQFDDAYNVPKTWYPTPRDPEWSDLEPIHLTESEKEFAYILTAENYNNIFAYLRALIAKQEFSFRGLKLSTVANKLLNSNYTVWDYRRQCLKALDADWDRELNYAITLAEAAPKSYQLWQHRKLCCVELNSPRDEMELLTQHLLEDEPKNYHAWGYRQWLLRKFPYELTQWLINNQKVVTPSGDDNVITIGQPTIVNDDVMQILLQKKYKTLNFMQNLSIEEIKKIPLYLLPIWQFEFEESCMLLGPDGDIRNNSVWSNLITLLSFPFSITPSPIPQTTALLENIMLTNLPQHKLYNAAFLSTFKQILTFALDKLTVVSQNEACYNVIFGLFNHVYLGVSAGYNAMYTVKYNNLLQQRDLIVNAEQQQEDNTHKIQVIEQQIVDLEYHIAEYQALLWSLKQTMLNTMQWFVKYYVLQLYRNNGLVFDNNLQDIQQTQENNEDNTQTDLLTQNGAKCKLLNYANIKPSMVFLYSFLFDFYLNLYKMLYIIDIDTAQTTNNFLINGITQQNVALIKEYKDVLTTTKDIILNANIKNVILTYIPTDVAEGITLATSQQYVGNIIRGLNTTLTTFDNNFVKIKNSQEITNTLPNQQIPTESAVVNVNTILYDNILPICIGYADVLMNIDTVRQKFWLWRQLQIGEILQDGDYSNIQPTLITPGAQWTAKQ